MYEKFKQNNALYRFYILATSSRIGVGRVTSLLKKDIDNLPFIKEPIHLNAVEKLIVKDVMSYFLKENQIKLSNLAIIQDIDRFSSVFCRTLNSIYQTEDKSFQLLKILDAGKYYALHFEYSSGTIHLSEETAIDLDEYIATIIPNREETQKNDHIQRIMKVYGKDCILLIKPKQLRYWLPSIALRDADEVFADYIKARYPDVEK